MTSVGVITLAHGRHDHLAAQHDSLLHGTRLPEDYLVVAMADPEVGPVGGALPRRVVAVPGTALGLPLARARNLGAAAALEAGAEVLVFLDVDCLAGADLVAAYTDVVAEHPATVWSGPVTYLPPASGDGYLLDELPLLDAPHPARPAPAPGRIAWSDRPELFWSLSFALAADAWQATGGFCEDYVGYGGEDTDFALLAEAAGLRHGWVGGARAYHQHHATSDPPVEHLDDVLRNGALFCRRWGRWPMEGWFEAFAAAGLVRRRGDGWVREETRTAG